MQPLKVTMDPPFKDGRGQEPPFNESYLERVFGKDWIQRVYAEESNPGRR